jgi:hypothetical protein
MPALACHDADHAGGGCDETDQGQAFACGLQLGDQLRILVGQFCDQLRRFAHLAMQLGDRHVLLFDPRREHGDAVVDRHRDYPLVEVQVRRVDTLAADSFPQPARAVCHLGRGRQHLAPRNRFQYPQPGACRHIVFSSFLQ